MDNAEAVQAAVLQSATGLVEKGDVGAEPISPPPSSRNSNESIAASSPQAASETPLRPSRRLPGSPSPTVPEGRRRSMSVLMEASREKSPESLLTLSDYNGSEESHAERRFNRQCEELESHCTGIVLFDSIDISVPFPEFITPWFLRRVNHGPCKAGDIVDLLRFLRPNGRWISPFNSNSVLDPFLSATLEKAIYPNVETFSPNQKALLQTLHRFIFSAYNYAQGMFFPFDGEWEDDRRDAPVDALDAYVEDMIGLIEYIRQNGRQACLRDFV